MNCGKVGQESGVCGLPSPLHLLSPFGEPYRLPIVHHSSYRRDLLALPVPRHTHLPLTPIILSCVSICHHTLSISSAPAPNKLSMSIHPAAYPFLLSISATRGRGGHGSTLFSGIICCGSVGYLHTPSSRLCSKGDDCVAITTPHQLQPQQLHPVHPVHPVHPISSHLIPSPRIPQHLSPSTVCRSPSPFSHTCPPYAHPHAGHLPRTPRLPPWRSREPLTARSRIIQTKSAKPPSAVTQSPPVAPSAPSAPPLTCPREYYLVLRICASPATTLQLARQKSRKVPQAISGDLHGFADLQHLRCSLPFLCRAAVLSCTVTALRLFLHRKSPLPPPRISSLVR